MDTCSKFGFGFFAQSRSVSTTIGDLQCLIYSVILHNIASDLGVYFKEKRWRNLYLVPDYEFVANITYHTN